MGTALLSRDDALTFSLGDRWLACLARLPVGPCRMVEVGVWRPHVCRHVLAARTDVAMTLVDPWRSGVRGTGAMGAWSQAAYERAYRDCVDWARPYAGRCDIWRCPSLSAAARMMTGAVDLVFLDGDHSAASVQSDLEAWWPRVRPDGWIGGHDFAHPDHPGVAIAVQAWADGRQINLDIDRTWWVRKGDGR